MAAHSAPAGKQVPVLSVTDDSVKVWFPFCKNRIRPTTQERRCWCRKCALTCPVHTLGAHFRSLPVGAQPFKHLSAAQALLALRELLIQLGVPLASVHRTHDFRRGHAEDMRLCGARLCEILGAGDWSSHAFITYMDKNKLECDAVEEAHTSLSDSDARPDE